jgi:hypothetical protein
LDILAQSLDLCLASPFAQLEVVSVARILFDASNNRVQPFKIVENALRSGRDGRDALDFAL